MMRGNWVPPCSPDWRRGRSMAEHTAVDVEGLSKHYAGRRGGIRALTDVSFTIRPGEVVALMGDNGAGKSTLLDLLCGLTEATAGTVEVLGRPPRDSVLAGEVAAMLQTGGLLPDVTVGETVRLVASFFGKTEAYDEVLELAGLTDIADRRIAICSGGEQQRVRFALALIPDARLLVLDEPTAGMDWRARAEFWDRMKQLAAAGRTLLYASHYADEVEGVADRILVLSSGRLVADIPAADLAGDGAFFSRLDALIRGTL